MDDLPAFSFDPSRVPFSRAGSWFAVSRRWAWGATPQTPAGHWHVRCLRDDPSPSEVLRIELTEEAGPIDPAALVASATAGRLTLATAGGGRLEVCVAEPDVLRLRIRGARLRLHLVAEPYGYAVPSDDGAVELVPGAATPRFRLSPIGPAGLALHAPWRQATHQAVCGPVHVDVGSAAGGAGGAWAELALRYYDDVPPAAGADRPFDDVVAAAERAFDGWAGAIPPLPPAFEPGRLVAAHALWSASVPPHGLYRVPVVLASKSWMSRTWSWDHCFVAHGLAATHPDLARNQLALLRDMQGPGGMLCDAFTSARRSWLSTKNPVHGWALRRLAAAAAVSGEQLAELYEPLARWATFWLRDRALDPADGLPCVLHPNECFDNTTHTMLDGPCKPPDTAAYLVLLAEALADAADRLGHPDDAVGWRAAAARVTAAMLDRLWTGERFAARAVADGRPAPGDSVFNLVPLVLGRRLPGGVVRALVDAVRQPARFLTPFGLASEALGSPFYDDASYVKGPVWAPPNLFVAEGLAAVGERSLAREVAGRWCNACVGGGMSENFNARTGAAQQDPAYAWTAATFLTLARTAGGAADR